MNIVVNKNVLMRIDSFVSILKMNFHFNEKNLLTQKNKMLVSLRNHINKVTQKLHSATKQELKYGSSYYYWEDGVSNYRWIFDYRVYYKTVLDLMERIDKNETRSPLQKIQDKEPSKIWTIISGMTGEEIEQMYKSQGGRKDM